MNLAADLWTLAIAGFATVFVWLVWLDIRRQRGPRRPRPLVAITQRPLSSAELAAYRRDWLGSRRTCRPPRRRNVPAYRIMRGQQR